MPFESARSDKTSQFSGKGRDVIEGLRVMTHVHVMFKLDKLLQPPRQATMVPTAH